MNGDSLLSVKNLTTRFRTDDGILEAVGGIDFAVDEGETVCIVGESGSGKTVASESITRLVQSPPGHIEADEVHYDGRDVLAMSQAELREFRGKEVAHVFQNPQGGLNPVYTVGWQIREAIQAHEDASNDEARQRAIDLMDRVGIPEASTRIDDHPHEFSGGQKQRVIIAMALASNPSLLIADEPTTALDVTIQAQILDLLRDLQDEYGMAVLFITHDLGVVAEIADRVVVMYAGKVMERGNVYDVFETPGHPYTQALLRCLPGRGEESASIGGQLPDPTDTPDGCRFAPRCPHAVDDCHVGDQPDLYAVPDSGTDHTASCVYYGPEFDASVVLEDQPSPSEGRGPTTDGQSTRTDGGQSGERAGRPEGGESR